MERRSTQVAETRDRILGAALELFSERGAQGTTLNELARRADVAPTTVSNHFKTQESLIEAVVERIVADIRVPDSTIFAGTRSVTGRLRILTRSMFEFLTARCTGSICWATNLWRCRRWLVPRPHSGARFGS